MLEATAFEIRLRVFYNEWYGTGLKSTTGGFELSNRPQDGVGHDVGAAVQH